MNPNNLDENIENDKKQVDWRKEFLKKFNTEVSAMSDTALKNQIIEDICTKDAETQDVTSKKQEVLANNRSKFGDIELNKISIFDLRKGLSGDFFRLENIKRSYISEVNSNYEISEKDALKLKKALRGLSFKEVQELTKDMGKNKDFLKKTFKGFIFGAAPKEESLSEVLSEDYAKRLNKIKDVAKREQIEQTLAILQHGTFRASDIEFLSTSGFLNKQEKLEIFRKYYKSISLEKAIEYGLLSEKEAKKKKEEVIKSVIAEKSTELDFSEKNLEYIGKGLSDEDIFLTSYDLNLDDKKIDTYIEKFGLQKMEDDFYDIQKRGENERGEKGPKNFRDFVETLEDKYKRQVLNVSHFKAGNYVEVTKTEKGGGEIKTIYKIVSEDNGNNAFVLKAVGVGNDIDLHSNAESENFLYANFLALLEKSGNDYQISANFKDKKELKKEIEDPNNPRFKENSFNSYDEESLEDGNIENHHKERLEKEILEIKAQLQEKPNDIFLKDLLKKKEDTLKRIESTNGGKLLNHLNLEKLIEQLDDVDTAGKGLGLHTGIYIEAKDGTAEIEGIDIEKQVIIVQGKKVPFSSFFEGFKKEKMKRVRKYTDFSQFLDAFKKEGKDIPDNCVFEGGKFIAKDVENGDKKGNQEIDFFEGKNGEIVKIEDISGDKVTVRLGEKKDGEKDKKGKQKYKYTLALQKNTETISLNDFKKELIAREMVPDWKIGKKDLVEEKEKGLDKEFKKSFGSRFMGRLSVSDLLSAGKLWIDNIEEHLKNGSDTLAAEKALKWGKWLPEEVRNSLQIKVESERRKNMNDAVDQLNNIGSGPAVKMVEEWILNLDSPQYKKEAGVMFMASKYGHLTAKGLIKYRGQFKFYQALGGKVGDKMYNDFKKKCEASDTGESFNEEMLVLELLGAQCKKEHYSGIERPSKLFKDYKGKLNGGVEEEQETGKKDASSMRNINDKITYANGEIEGGTTANGIGAVEAILGQGGTLKELSDVVFCLNFSGMLYNTGENAFLKLKKLAEAGNPHPLLWLSANSSTHKIANDAILEISKEITKANPDDYPKLAGEAQELYDNVHSKKKNQKALYSDTMEFYKKYGEVIMRSLYSVDSDDQKFAKTDKLLIGLKDKNPILNSYYKEAQGIATEDVFFGKDQMKEWGTGQGLTGINKFQNTVMHLGVTTNKNFENVGLAPKIWETMMKDIYATKNKLFDSSVEVHSTKNHQSQKQYVIQSLREIFAGLRYKQSGDQLSYYSFQPKIGTTLKEWGIDILRDFGDLDPDDILAGRSSGESIFSGVADQILNSSGISVSEDDTSSSFLSGEQALDDIKNQTSGVLDASNEEEFNQKQAA